MKYVNTHYAAVREPRVEVPEGYNATIHCVFPITPASHFCRSSNLKEYIVTRGAKKVVPPLLELRHIVNVQLPC
jgi:hypothetical protein